MGRKTLKTEHLSLDFIPRFRDTSGSSNLPLRIRPLQQIVFGDLRVFRQVVFFTLFVSSLLSSIIARSQTESILYNFRPGTDIIEPFYGVVFDSQGNLYGTSFDGGANSMGGVFQLSPNGNGWNETVVHPFTGSPSDGSMPYAAPVVDSAGNIYATTFYGGNTRGCSGGCGTLVKLTQTSPGVWTETPVYWFQGRGSDADGAHPLAIGLNSLGYPYGVTSNGGSSNIGTFYQIVPTANGGYAEEQLFDFANSGVSFPQGGLAVDSEGNVYGSSLEGGVHNLGAVFELSPGANGTWTETTIYSFSSEHGNVPYPNPDLVIDTQGNLYGTVRNGGLQNTKCGTAGCGFVFQLTKTQNGTWQLQPIYKFRGGNDGNGRWDGVILDGAGNLYGTTLNGGGKGASNGICRAGTNIVFCGTVYELSPQSDGSYAETILHRFGSLPDGAEPAGRLVLDSAGNLYGTTSRGGDATCGFGYGCGIVFKITP